MDTCEWQDYKINMNERMATDTKLRVLNHLGDTCPLYGIPMPQLNIKWKMQQLTTPCKYFSGKVSYYS